jgi:serine phosphatase RsbU (regulator of sigma subunit)
MPHMEIQTGVAKIGKYATGESGDTVEVVERPHGGISLVVVDGQRSGRSAKTISNLVARKALSLLAEGVRDGAVARATHDYLRTHRRGQVSAELSIISVDLTTQTLVISRNSRCPVLIRTAEGMSWLSEETEAVGIHPKTKPSIHELPIQPQTTILIFTDGVHQAGIRYNEKMDILAVIEQCDPLGDQSAQTLADAILNAAISLDRGRPQDDATVVVLKVAAQESSDEIRRMTMIFPI